MKTLFCTLSLFLICSSASMADIYSIAYEPTNPVAGEPVTITVDGNVPSTSWSIVGQSCGIESANELTIGISTYDCIGRECSSQGWAFTHFQAICTYTFDDPGV